MADWVWVLPSEAEVGRTCAGRTIIKVHSKKEMRPAGTCRKTYRLLPTGYYQLVLIE